MGVTESYKLKDNDKREILEAKGKKVEYIRIFEDVLDQC